MFISVIVPVYNSEKYIATCIESIINQTYKDIEVILIDDGSMDDSLKICVEYAKTDTRISVIQAKHQGLVMTRKLGIEAATGEYCVFVDSDDWIAENMLEFVLPFLIGKEIEIINYNMCTVTDKGTAEWRYSVPEGIYEGRQLQEIYKKMMFDFEVNYPGIIQSLCTKVIKTELLKVCIEAVDSRITLGEDAAVVYNAMLKAKKIAVIHKPFYFYRIHSESMTHSKNIEVFTQIDYFNQYMEQLFANYCSEYELKKQLQAYLIHFIEIGLDGIFFLKLCDWYNIPFGVIQKLNKRIVLYGAGEVGKSYYRQLERIKEIEIVAWVDEVLANRRLFDYKIDSPEILRKLEYDNVLIAIKSPSVVKKIREKLTEFIDDKKILWDNPKMDFWHRELVYDFKGRE